jgi:hypothetical protein
MAPETFNLRLEELAVIDMAFLATGSSSSSAGGAGSSAAAAAATANPVLALLYEDNKHARHVKTYTLNLKTRVGGVCTSQMRCMFLLLAASLWLIRRVQPLHALHLNIDLLHQWLAPLHLHQVRYLCRPKCNTCYNTS